MARTVHSLKGSAMPTSVRAAGSNPIQLKNAVGAVPTLPSGSEIFLIEFYSSPCGLSYLTPRRCGGLAWLPRRD